MQHPIEAWLAADLSRSKAQLAEAIGCHKVHLNRLIRADGNFSSDMFDRVEVATKGGVPAVTLFAFYQQQRRAARQAREGSAATRS